MLLGKVTYCKKCVLPSSSGSIEFDEDDICSACHTHAEVHNIDWDNRMERLKTLQQYQSQDRTNYDLLYL